MVYGTTCAGSVGYQEAKGALKEQSSYVPAWDGKSDGAAARGRAGQGSAGWWVSHHETQLAIVLAPNMFDSCWNY